MSKVDIDQVKNQARLTKIVYKKGNSDYFLKYPTKANGMMLSEAHCLTGFIFGLAGKKSNLIY